jgi:DNA-binding MarR family transcriptional regulator
MRRVQFARFNKNGANGNGHYRDPFSEFSLSVLGFLRASKKSAIEAGLTAMEYDLMLALSAYPQSTCPNIAILGERLLIHHHVASEAVGRLADRDLIRTKRNARDRRSVNLSLTAAGESLLQQIAVRSVEALKEKGPRIAKSLTTLIRKNGSSRIEKM